MIIRRASAEDMDEIERLYDTLNDHLEAGINYPHWRKDFYPTRETASAAIDEGSLFTLHMDGAIAGAVVLNHTVPEAYNQGTWSISATDSEVLIVHTLAVHPNFLRCGIAFRLMDFAAKYAKEENLKAIRLDTPAGNNPAIALYEKCGYQYAGTVDLRLGVPGLYWFRLYELLIL